MKTTTLYTDGSNGDNSKSKLSNEEAHWLIKVRSLCIQFIRNQDEKLSREDAEDIYANELEILSKRGFHDLYSTQIRLDVQRGLHLSHEEKIALLSYHLKRRVIDFFRKIRTRTSGYVPSECGCEDSDCDCHGKKRGWHRITEVSEFVVTSVPDHASELAFEKIEARSDLDTLCNTVWPFLNESQRAILAAARRNPADGFKSSSLHEAMTKAERELFLPKDRSLVVDENDCIKKAIARRTSELRRQLQGIIADDPGKFPFYAA